MPDYANATGSTLILLSLILLSLIKGNETWRISTLLVGILLIILASLSFGIFTDMNGLFDLLAQKKRIDEDIHTQAKTLVGVWVFILPTVTGAIGVNLITAWLLSKKPS